MKQTYFTFFKNTPLIDFQNTIHFDSNRERDEFFLEGDHYTTLTDKKPFNFIRDQSTLVVDIPYHEFAGVNYATFLSDFEPNTRFYAYVVEYEYVNDNAVRVYLLIDSIMTYTQGAWLQQLPNLTITRQHLPRVEYDNRAWELKNNDDILKTSTKRYIHEEEVTFDNLVIVIQSSADLTGNFGTEDDPHIQTSEGVTFDHISSPLELYVVYQDDFADFMEALNPYPWIAQNITSMQLIPEDFIENRFDKTSTWSTFDFDELYRLRDGLSSINSYTEEHFSPLNKTMSELYDLFNLDEDEDKHLLRSEYTTTEFYTYNGQQLLLDNGLLNPRIGIKLNVEQVIGFSNEVHMYPVGYQTDELMEGNDRKGGFLNNSISFDHFDDIPMLIDNYSLALANNANQRELAESRQPTNRIQNVMDDDASMKDRFYDAASLVSGFSMSSMFGKFSNEHKFYQDQQAEFADLALSTPTITNQTHGNSLQIANGFFGLTEKFSAPTENEWDEIKKYYKLFGYHVNENGSRLQDVHSMTVCNYVQFSGSWTIQRADVALVEMMKAQFENGVRLWHNNGTANPMNQDPLNNEMR